MSHFQRKYEGKFLRAAIFIIILFRCKKGEQTFIYHSHRHFSILLEISVFASYQMVTELLFRKSNKKKRYSSMRNSLVLLGFASLCLARVGAAWFGAGNLPAYRA